MVSIFKQSSADASRPKPHTPRVSRGRTILTALLLVVALCGLLGATGCQMLTPPPPVNDNVEQAFKDGAAKDKAAQDALDKNRKDDATKLWDESAKYYGAVANKFTGKNHIDALLAEAQAQEKMVDAQTAAGDVHDYSAALASLRSARQDSAADPALHAEVEPIYEDLIARMDQENSHTKQYWFMAQLVRMLGNNTESAPILAVLCISVAVVLVTWPLRVKQARSARELARYQPEIKKLTEKYKANPQEQYQKMQEFNKKHGINQFAGCLPAVLQMPIVFIMYRLILSYQFHFRHTTFLWITPGFADTMAHLGLPWQLTAPNLGEQDIVLLLLYAVSMYVQTKLTPITTTDPSALEQQKMMAKIMPVMFFFMMVRYNLPSAFVLYWFSSNVLGAAQQWYINRSLPKLEPLVLDEEENGEIVDNKPLKANPKLISPSANKPRKK